MGYFLTDDIGRTEKMKKEGQKGHKSQKGHKKLTYAAGPSYAGTRAGIAALSNTKSFEKKDKLFGIFFPCPGECPKGIHPG